MALLPLASVLLFVSGPTSPSGAATVSASPLSTPQLLANPSFDESPGIPDWSWFPGTNVATYTNGTAFEDHTYLETNAGAPAAAGASVYQDVPFSAVAGAGYRGTMMLRSPTGRSETVVLALWAIDGTNPATGAALPNVSASTTVTLSPSGWNRAQVELDVANAGYSDLRLQLYVPTSGANVDADGAVLQSTGLANASFEQGLVHWSSTGAGVNAATYLGGAFESARFMELNTSSPGQGMAQSVPAGSMHGRGYRVTAELRSPTTAPVRFELVLQTVGGTVEQSVTRGSIASRSWGMRTASLDVSASGHTGLRVGVLLLTKGANLDVDAVQLEPTGMQNADFHDGTHAWGRSSASNVNYVTYPGAGALGSGGYLEANSSRSGASVGNLMNWVPVPGQGYQASVYLRSPTGAPVSVHLALQGRKGLASVAQGVTDAVVRSTAWTRYSVDFDAPGATYSGMRFQIVFETTGVNLDVDAAELLVPEGASVSAQDDCRTPDNCTPATFAAELLVQPGIDAPPTPANIFALEWWEAAEGGGAGCTSAQKAFSVPWVHSGGPAGNPMNTTQGNAGVVTDWNTIGVKVYGTKSGHTCWYWGVGATTQTLVNGYYAGILHALQNPQPTDVAQCTALGVAVGKSPWGTGNFAATEPPGHDDCLDGNPDP